MEGEVVDCKCHLAALDEAQPHLVDIVAERFGGHFIDGSLLGDVEVAEMGDVFPVVGGGVVEFDADKRHAAVFVVVA